MFNDGDGFCVNDVGWIFCLLCGWVFCVYGRDWVFCLMLVVCYLFTVMAGLFVYCDGWVFCSW